MADLRKCPRTRAIEQSQLENGLLTAAVMGPSDLLWRPMRPTRARVLRIFSVAFLSISPSGSPAPVGLGTFESRAIQIELDSLLDRP